MLHRTPHACIAAALGTTIFLIASCSSKTPDTGLDGAGGTGGSGASSQRGGSGGKGGSSSGGSSGTLAATGGSVNATGGSVNGAGGSVNATGGSANATSSGGSGAAPTDACPGVALDDGGQGGACTGVSMGAEPVPIDLFIMMDRSVSMGNTVTGTNMTRWDALQQAVQAFADSTTGDDVRAGIGFFGITGGSDDVIDCNEGNYSKPVVAIDTLDKSGPAIISAMANMVPGGLTPSGPALTGALDYAASWAKDNPKRATGVVLVTDGYPTQCQPLDPNDIATIADQAYKSSPSVRTYVIGLDGDYNLDAIARSGGTHSAFKVDEGSITSSFTTALENVTNTQLACNYALPAAPDGSEKLDFTRVQVTYTPAGNAPTEEIPALAGGDACANAPNGGWYYDVPTAPTSIEVCPCTCSRFAAGRVDVRVGCRPAVGPR